MMELLAGSDHWTATTTTPGDWNATSTDESAMAVEFVASLFRTRTNDVGTSSISGWNVTFPGLSLQPQDDESSSSPGPHHTTTRHAAEIHAVTLLRRPSNKSLRENAYASFQTLVNARLNAYIRRWPAVAGLLQYRMQPTTLLSRLEVLQQQPDQKSSAVAAASDCNTTKDDTNASTSTTKLAVCCWSMAMDLILEREGHDVASRNGHDDTTNNGLLSQSPVISVSFSTLGSISKDSGQSKHLIVELDLQVLLSEMIRQASTVVSTMVKLVGKSPPQPPSTKELPATLLISKQPPVEKTSGCDDSMPPPPPRRKRPAVVVVSPDLSSSTAHRDVVVPDFHLGDSSLSVDQCADIIDTCLTEFTPVKSTTATGTTKRPKFVSTNHP